MESPVRAATSGFTALELLITVAILGLVTSLTVPALWDFVLEQRAVSGLNEFVAAVNFARNEAIRRGVSVTLCASLAPSRETRMRRQKTLGERLDPVRGL